VARLRPTISPLKDIHHMDTITAPAAVHTALRFTSADVANLATIADALRAEGLLGFPTKTDAFRFALRSVVATLAHTGHLPSAATVRATHDH
jgi:hypothetical protein